MVDYYNDMPSGINVIDKMNEELDDLQKRYDALKQKVKQLNETIRDYKDNVIFDFFFNHELDIEKQKELKNKIYSDDDDIFFCKNCNEYTYEEYMPVFATKYCLYRSCKEEPYCEDCFNGYENEIDNTILNLMYPNTFPPGKIKINTQFFRESIYLKLIKQELKKCEGFDEKDKKMEEFSNKYFDIIVGPQENKKYVKEIIEEYINNIYIYSYYTDEDSDEDEPSVE